MQIRSITFLLLALAPTIVAPVYAQDAPPEALPRWYQIELLIFANNRADTEEVFREQPFEDETNSIASDAPLLNSLLGMQANGEIAPWLLAEQSLEPQSDASDDFVAEALPEFVAPNEAPDAVEPTTDSADAAIATDSPAAPAFIAVDNTNHLLTNHHEQLRRRSAYRVLWHGAWQQPLEEDGPVNTYSLTAGRLLLVPRMETTTPEAPSSEADPLDELMAELSQDLTEDITTIASSEPLLDTTDNKAPNLADAKAIVAAAPASFRELQGSFKIYKTRFAHLELDLWFSQIDEAAPGMMLPQLLLYPTPHSPAAHSMEPMAQLNDAAPEATDAIPTVSAADFLDEPTAGQPEELADTLPGRSGDDSATQTEQYYELRYELAYEPVLFGHIKEDRRLRPEELYYVDHPLFGAIIKMVEVPHPTLAISPPAEGDSDDVDPLAF